MVARLSKHKNVKLMIIMFFEGFKAWIQTLLYIIMLKLVQRHGLMISLCVYYTFGIMEYKVLIVNIKIYLEI